MQRALYVLIGAAVSLLASYCLGRMLFQKLRIRLYKEELHLLSLVTGAALFHLVIFAILSAQIAHKGVFIAAEAAILLAAWRQGIFQSSGAPPLPPLPKLWKWLFLAAYCPYVFLYLANAMAPEMSPDGSSYHLGLVSLYLRHHGFPHITTNMYANLSQGVEMLYTAAFAIGRHSSASVVHVAFTLTLPLLMVAHARRFQFPAAGVGGAIFLLCTPVVGVDGTTAYNDLVVTMIVFSVYAMVRIWAEENQGALIIPIGLTAGYAFASKYTAAIAIPFAAAFIVVKLWRNHRPLLKPIATFCICVAIMAVPWLVKNWIIVGNPMSPFLNKYFPNPNIRISFEQEYVERMRHYGDPKSYWDVPLDLTIHGAMLSGMLGPLFLLTPLCLLALRFKEGRYLVLTAIYFGLPYLSNIGTRFLLPSLPFFSLALALTVARTPLALPALMAFHAFLSWPHVLKTYCSPYAWRLERIPIAAALRLTNEEKYLTDRSYGYVVARMIEDHVPKGGKVFTFGGVAEAYTTRQVLTAYQSGSNNNLGDFIWTALFQGLGPQRQLRYNFPEKPIRRIKIVQMKTSSEQFGVTELRLLHQNKELPRSPDWRLRAMPNPWDVQLAFDNSPVTRWKSWESMRPGMFVEVDLGKDQIIDSVLLETTNDQYQAELQLYVQSENKDWLLVKEPPQTKEVPQLRGLRRAAMEELRARNIHYILAMPDDPAAKDYFSNRILWGIRLLADRAGARIYAIEEAMPIEEAKP